MACWRGKCAPIWSIASSRALGITGCHTPRPSASWDCCWAPRSCSNCTSAWSIRGNKLRVDTTVVETNIHYPTDSVLLGDGVRVLTRVMRQINEVVGDRGEKLRDRRRSVGHRLIEIGRASRGRGPQVQKKLEQGYRKLLGTTGQVVAQAKRFSQEIVKGVKRSADVLQQ